jgi:hypothetical protein
MMDYGYKKNTATRGDGTPSLPSKYASAKNHNQLYQLHRKS